MRTLIVIAGLMLAGCAPPAAPPTFDVAGLKPTPDGDTATLTGWFRFTDRSFTLTPSKTKPADGAPCLSGVLLSLAGVPTPDFNDREMSVTGYVFGVADDAAQGAANPCNSQVILEAIEVSTP